MPGIKPLKFGVELAVLNAGTDTVVCTLLTVVRVALIGYPLGLTTVIVPLPGLTPHECLITTVGSGTQHAVAGEPPVLPFKVDIKPWRLVLLIGTCLSTNIFLPHTSVPSIVMVIKGEFGIYAPGVQTSWLNLNSKL